ncbi:MAG: hypothetical protein ACREUG_12350 [Steroidobacteraceae bacterium]
MSALSAAFDAVVALVKSEEERALLPQLATALENIAGNPTMPNAIAQGNLLLTEVIADQTKIGQDALKQLAESVSNAAVAAVPPVAK